MTNTFFKDILYLLEYRLNCTVCEDKNKDENKIAGVYVYSFKFSDSNIFEKIWPKLYFKHVYTKEDLYNRYYYGYKKRYYPFVQLDLKHPLIFLFIRSLEDPELLIICQRLSKVQRINPCYNLWPNCIIGAWEAYVDNSAICIQRWFRRKIKKKNT